MQFDGAQSAKVLDAFNASSLQFVIVRRCSGSSGTDSKRRRRRNLFELTKTNYALYKDRRVHISVREMHDKQTSLYSCI